MDQAQSMLGAGYSDPNRVGHNGPGPGIGHMGYNSYLAGTGRDNMLGAYGSGLNNIGSTAGPGGVYQNNVGDMSS